MSGTPSHPPSIIDRAVTATFEHQVQVARTADERRLARMLADLYQLTKHQPEVIEYINHWALGVLDQGDAA